MAKDNLTNKQSSFLSQFSDIETEISNLKTIVEDDINNKIEKLVDDGKVFTHLDYYIFAADEVKDFVFDPIDYTGSKLRVFTPTFNSTAGPITIDVYFGTDAVRDPLKELFIYNRNGKSPNVAKSKIYLNPTINSLGIRPGGRIVAASGNNPATGQPGEAEESIPVIIDETKKILFRVKNLNGADTYVELNTVFVEF